MGVDIIVVPFLVLIAGSVILGDQTSDGDLVSVNYSDSGGGDCRGGGDP